MSMSSCLNSFQTMYDDAIHFSSYCSSDTCVAFPRLTLHLRLCICITHHSPLSSAFIHPHSTLLLLIMPAKKFHSLQHDVLSRMMIETSSAIRIILYKCVVSNKKIQCFKSWFLFMSCICSKFK